MKKIDGKQTSIFLYENIITRFGCPKILVSDRGSHYLNETIEHMTEMFQINHRKTTLYHPQTIGHTEKVNQTLVRILRKTISNNKRDWDIKLIHLMGILYCIQGDDSNHPLLLDVWG